MATSRSSRESRARYTSPMLPAPSGEIISYWLSLVPGTRDIFAAIIVPGEKGPYQLLIR